MNHISPIDFGELVVDDEAAGIFKVSRTAMTSHHVFEAELERVFGRTWLYVGHASEVPNPTDFVTRNVGGRPIIMVRGRDDGIRVLLNTCTHRGAVVCRERAGSTRFFRCLYHGWTFDTAGALVGVPAKDGCSPSFRQDEMGLVPAARVDVYRDFVFASFDAGVPDLPTYLGRAAEYLDNVADQSEVGMEVVGGTHEYTVRANWKLVVENAVDGYHVLPLHASYVEWLKNAHNDAAQKMATRRTEGIPLENGHAAIVDWAPWGRPLAKWAPPFPPEMEPVLEARYRALVDRHGEERAIKIARRDANVVLFPNTAVNNVMGVTVRTVYPLGPDLMRVSAWALVPKDATDEERALTLSSFVSFLGPGGFATPDDVEALESCQEGFAAAREVPWSDLSRGLLTNDGSSSDEGQQRSFWRQWRSLMTSASIAPVSVSAGASK